MRSGGLLGSVDLVAISSMGVVWIVSVIGVLKERKREREREMIEE